MKIHSSAPSALASVISESRIFIHGGAATPHRLIEALVGESYRLRNVEILHLHTVGSAPYAAPEQRDHFRVSAFFVGPNLRAGFEPGFVDYIPCNLSDIPRLLRSRAVPIDIALVHVSPPDAHGFCSLGVSVDAARAATESARIVIAQINAQMPRVHGDGLIHISQIHHAIEVDEALPEMPSHRPTATELSIAAHAVPLIEDGSTLQIGIGAIPDAILGALDQHRHLGIHSEMWSDGALKLIRCGAVDNSKKRLHPGRSVSGFLLGSRELYDFIDDNPSVLNLDVAYVNNPFNIARNPKVVAINSAVEIDLSGQVCADSVGHRIISGAGGQMDFVRGAAQSEGGKSIIALTSRTQKSVPRIVPALKSGAGVVTTRADARYVVTEYGVADLYGKTIAQRARALIKIAHPDDAAFLEKQFFDREPPQQRRSKP